MKKRLISILCCAALAVSMISTTVSAAENEDASENVSEQGTTEKDEVVVDDAAYIGAGVGFDPAYGWGAGEHVHEPLIQSTLTVTTADLQIANDLATEYSVSDDGLTWTVKIRDDVKFTGRGAADGF